MSSSGVVNALVDFVGFDESIVAVLRKYDAYPTCLSQVVAAIDALDALSSEDLQKTKGAVFNASNLAHTAQGDVDFFYMVADATAMLVQYGNKASLCKAMTATAGQGGGEDANDASDGSDANTPVSLLAATIAKFYGPAFGAGCFYDSECIRTTLKDGDGVGNKAWRWQKCTLLGYLQSRPTTASVSAARSRSLTAAALRDQCQYMFPDNTGSKGPLGLAANNAEYQQRFGGDRPDKVGTTRVLYLDYSDDPWQRASVAGSPGDTPSLPYCYTTCDGCGHCGAGVPANETRCSDEQKKWVARWMAE